MLSNQCLGVPSWQVWNIHGSMIMIEFGDPVVEIREPVMRPTHLDAGPTAALRRQAFVHGGWTLTLEYCEWELWLTGALVADSESLEPTMSRALKVLQGQALTAIAVEPESGATAFSFDLGALVLTKPAPSGFYGSDPAEQWTLGMPDNRNVAVRDDGTFSTHRGDADPDQYVWSRLRR